MSKMKLGLVSMFLWMVPTFASAEVILHAFNWSYRNIGDRAAELAEIGYGKVLVATPAKSQGNEWWSRYQPQDLRVIDHVLGNKEDFQYMITELGKYNIGVYADIVLNHMANEAWKRSDLNYPGDEVIRDYDEFREYFEANRIFGNIDFNLFSSYDFNDNFCISDYSDFYQVKYGRVCAGFGDPGLPDLRESDYVIRMHQDYVQTLAAMGVQGFRIDAAKHMTNYHMNRVFENLPNTYIFGEIITFGGTSSNEFQNY